MIWPGGEHNFKLNIGELRALQKNCDAGPEEILNRLRLGTWRVDDLIQTLRLGLIGSGEMTDKEAGPFVLGLFDQHPKVDFKLPALAILATSLLGEADDEVGEPEGEAPPPENGALATSTETEPS